MLILILGSKSGFGDDFRQYDTKIIILRHFFGQTPLRNRVTMATPKIPGDQKNVLKGVLYVNPIRPVGGSGGSEAWMTKLTAANQKPLIL